MLDQILSYNIYNIQKYNSINSFIVLLEGL